MTECPDQTARMRTLTRNFAVRIWHKGIFHTLRIIYDRNFPIVITKEKSQRMTKPKIRLVRPARTQISLRIRSLRIQRMTKPSIRLVWPAKTQISLRIRAGWSESLPVACAFYSLRAVQRGMNKNPLSLCWSHMSYCGFCQWEIAAVFLLSPLTGKVQGRSNTNQILLTGILCFYHRSSVEFNKFVTLHFSISTWKIN